MARAKKSARQQREHDRRVALKAIRDAHGNLSNSPAFLRIMRFIADRVALEARRPRRAYPEMPYKPAGGLERAIIEVHVDPTLDVLKSIPFEYLVECDLLQFQFDDNVIAFAQTVFPGPVPFGQWLAMLMAKDAFQAVLEPDVQHENAIRRTLHTWMPEVRRRQGLPPIVGGEAPG